MPTHLEQLLDRERVVDTVTRLFIATDQRDWDAVERCFADRVRFDMSAGSRRRLEVHLPLAVLRRATNGRLRLRVSVVPAIAGGFMPLRRPVRLVVPARLATAHR